MKKNLLLVCCLIGLCTWVMAQQTTRKLVLITLDGYRWQELFGGADSLLINNKKYVRNIEELKQTYWRSTPEERRKVLMPFVWSTIAEQGVMLGNRYDSSRVEVTNAMHFSYPGYNELLTGVADDKNIISNGKIYNPNVSILEKANNMPAYKGKVLAFGSWDAFPFILNEQRSGIAVNAGYRHALSTTPSEYELFLNNIQDQTPHYWQDERYDVFTHQYALQALKNQKPCILYVAYGETDEFAHAGKYDDYLKAVTRSDHFIRELWEYVQQDPYYQGQTTFIITTDHGRGDEKVNDGKHTWTDHHYTITGSHETWILALGNEIMKPHSPMPTPYYTNQIAATIAHIMRIPYTKTMGEPLYNILILR